MLTPSFINWLFIYGVVGCCCVLAHSVIARETNGILANNDGVQLLRRGRRRLMGNITSNNNEDDSHASNTHDHSHPEFRSLSCNQNVTEEPCTPWSEYFGPTNAEGMTFSERVTIPCGICVRLEEHTDLTFEDGLEVVGRLLIVPAFAGDDIAIRTTSIIVQGVLSIYNFADRIPQDHSKLHITLYGSGEETHFIPHEENMNVCNPCNAGKMPIVVAGGTLDIYGMPANNNSEEEDCPTWTDLIRVATGGPPSLSEEEQDEIPTFPCGSENNQVLISPDSNSENDWSHWDTADSISTVSVDPIDMSLLTTGRTKSTQGPRVQIYPPPNGDPCLLLQPGVPYLLSAKIKITPETEDFVSTCQTNGKCLYLQLQKIGRYNKSTLRTIDFSRHDAPTLDGEYFAYSAIIEVTQVEIDEVQAYNGKLYLHFKGIPAPNYNLNINDVMLLSAPYVTHTCNELLINGDANFGHYYPWIPRSGGNILSMEEDDGKSPFFRNEGRGIVYSGLEQDVLPSCLKEGLQYELSLRTRIISSDASKTAAPVIKFFLTMPTGSTKSVELARGSHQSAADSWVLIKKIFPITKDMADATGIKLVTMISEGGPAATVDYADISIKFHTGVGKELFVTNPDIGNCWGVGGQIVITPSTNMYTDAKVVTVVDVGNRIDDEGKRVGVIGIDGDPGFHPDVGISDPRTRPEVAILSRNIIVTAEPDPTNSLHGGHLIIFHTPNVAQHLEGVEFVGMGQQGNLGRYPIHFHISKSVSGSIVRSNSVHSSNQRCIVIHGTHHVLVENNIAYNTKGHCFITEDGNEHSNVFRKNLGAQTLPVQVENLLSSVDSDHKPATFWMATPRNTLIENVAAGAADSGFWYEVEGFHRGNSATAQEVLDGSLPFPSRQEMGIFDGNKAHSNYGVGLKTYPSGGYKPPNEAVFANFISIRNKGAGVFSHNGLNQSFVGGFIADNAGVGIDIDRSYKGRVQDVSFSGYTAEYQAIVQSPGIPSTISQLSPCGFNKPIRGLQLHAFKSGGSVNVGYKISNLTFTRYGSDATRCVDSIAVDVDAREDSGYFDPRTSFSDMHFHEEVNVASSIDLCPAKDAGINYVAIKDDGNAFAASAGLDPSTQGYLISDNPLLTTLPDGCTRLAGESGCAFFCPGVCIRSLKVSVPSSLTPADTLLVIIDTSTGRSISAEGEFDIKMMGSQPDQYKNTWYTLTGVYRVYMPIGGTYAAKFVTLAGQDLWPKYVEAKYEDIAPDGCDGVHLDISFDDTSSPPQCWELITTGDGEGWMHSGGGVYALEDGTIENRDRDSYANGLVHYVDVRCLEEGSTFNFTAKVQLFDGLGDPVDCDAQDRKCPFFRLISSAGPEGTTTAYREFFGFTSWNIGEWNEVSATITISSDEAAKSKSMVYIYGSSHSWGLRVKDVSMVPV